MITSAPSLPTLTTPRKEKHSLKITKEDHEESSSLEDRIHNIEDSKNSNTSHCRSVQTDITDPEDPLFGKGSPLYSPLLYSNRIPLTSEGMNENTLSIQSPFKPFQFEETNARSSNEVHSRQYSTTQSPAELNISPPKENPIVKTMNEETNDVMVSQYNPSEHLNFLNYNDVNHENEKGEDTFDLKSYLEKYGVGSVDMNDDDHDDHHQSYSHDDEIYEDDEETQNALNFGSTFGYISKNKEENDGTVDEEEHEYTHENEEETHQDYDHTEQATEENNHNYQYDEEEQQNTNNLDDEENSLESAQDDNSESEEDAPQQQERSFVLYMPKTLTPKSQSRENNHSSIVIKSPTGSQNQSNSSSIEKRDVHSPVSTNLHVQEKAISKNYTKNVQQREDTKRDNRQSVTIKEEKNEPPENDDDSSKPKFSMLKRNSRWGSLLSKISKPGTYVPPTNKHSKAAVLSKTAKKQQQQEESTELNQESSHPPKKQTTNSQKKPPTPEISSQKSTTEGTINVTTTSHDTSLLPQPKRAAPAVPKAQQPKHEEEPPSLQNYFSRRDPPIGEFNTVGEYGPLELEHSDDNNDEEEDNNGWGSFINRNTVYNPYHYEQPSISSTKYQSPHLSGTTQTRSPVLGGQIHPPSTSSVIDKRESMNSLNSNVSPSYQQRTGSIISNFFLPKVQEEEKKRQMKEKIEKKKEEKRNREEEEKKLKELEEQLIFYKNENEKTKRLKDELVVERQNMECEQSEFKRYMEEERERFEKYKQQELQKINREKRILERQLKEHQQSLSRKEHEKEVNELKERLEKLLLEKKNESTKYKSTIQALKTRNEQLTERIVELEEILKKRELERIDNVFVNKKKQVSQESSSQQVVTLSPQMNNQPHQQQPSITNNKRPTTDPSTNNNSNSTQQVNSLMSSQQAQHHASPVMNDSRTNAKPKTASLSNASKKTQSSSSFSNTAPYSKDHKLALLKRTYKVSDQEFVDGEIVWEPLRISTDSVTSKVDMGNGKIEIKYKSGRRDIQFSNGTTKKLYPDKSCLVFFNNGDIKKTFEDGVVVYYYDSLQTTHISYPNGLEMYKFPNTQIERHFPSGEKEIVFPDKTVKFVDSNGSEEIWFSDGTYTQTFH
ncbi:hypothetical protein FDP41_006860 [Naegleria fowleri]|uniref:Centromere protein J C-terminal domain-containing protein n=1 Tax=Naegleria fowleri TaxID=5763 RepID=A0A6A5BJQ7_NAEFO|nr:uncharacterized protein FDP41_006860 [Naegleria fowleri]KAF0974250.1 hypothetical protein FDP41_006860 [Naegleria fowleri]